MAREKAGYLQYLRLKGIRPGGCFCFGSEPERLYRVTKSGRLLNLADEPAELTENDFWERLDELCPVAEEKFGEARRRLLDRIWASKGKMTSAGLEPAARFFAREYTLRYAQGRWKEIGRYDEETMRRILHRSLELLGGAALPPRERRSRLEEMFRDAVQARSEALGRRAKGGWRADEPP